MRPRNRVLVMRRAPMIGRPGSPLRISVARRCLTLREGLYEASYALALDRRQHTSSVYWIAAAGVPAHRLAHGPTE